MLTFMNHQKKKYLILLPLVFLILNAFYHRHATKEIQSALLREKHTEIIDAVNMLAAVVDADLNREWFDHERNIQNSMEFLDRLYQVYGSAYKIADGQLVLITERFYETSPFEPLEFPEFWDAIFTQESGSLIIGYTPEGQDYRDLHLYFRWMPLYFPADERYLVIAGVSKDSITSTLALWVSIGQWVSMAITFLINAWLITLLARLGYIYEERDGDKWRDRKGRR